MRAAPAAAPVRRDTAGGASRRSRRLILLPLGAARLYLALGSPRLPGSRWARARGAAGAALDHGTGRAGRGASRAESGRRPRLGGDGAGLYAARPLRRRGEGAAQCAAAARRERRARGRSRRGADRRRERRRHRRGEGGVRPRASALDPNDVRARYFLGLAAEQDGRPKEAAEIWRTLLARRAGGRAVGGLRAGSLARVDPCRGGDAAGPERRRRRGRERDVARAARHDGPRHGGAACRAAEAGRLRRRGLAAAGARLYGAGRQGAGARRRRRCAPRARRAIPTSCGRSTS